MYRMPETQTGAECIECQKHKRDVQWFRTLLGVVFFISMQITCPVAYFASNGNMTFLTLFDLFPLILYYFCAS